MAIPAIAPPDRLELLLAGAADADAIGLEDDVAVPVAVAVVATVVAVVVNGSSGPSEGQGSPGCSMNVEFLAN